MNTGSTIVALIGVLLALVLVLRGSSLRQMPRDRRVVMAGAWAAIIVGLAVAIGWLSE